MHNVVLGGYTLILGLLSLSFCAFFRSRDIIDEATFSGFHTKVVKAGLRLGFMLFIISEIMLFFGFFRAFFHAALCPSVEIGSIFPPEGIYTIPAVEFPLSNTFVLIFSGFSVTRAHRAVSSGSFKDSIDSLSLTILLGFFFVILQMFEYYEAPFSYSDSVYGCSFHTLTGLHGCHVIVGVFFSFIRFIRLLKRHYLTTHYLGLVLAI